MKSSIAMIFEKYPNVEEKFLDENFQLQTNQEDVFYQLALFFDDPVKFSFNISLLYKFLEDNDLIFALQVIIHFFKHNTYLIKENTNLIVKNVDEDLEIFNQKMFAEYLTENGFDFTPQKLNTYKGRGVLPKADLEIGGKSYWFKESVDGYLRELKDKNR